MTSPVPCKMVAVLTRRLEAVSEWPNDTDSLNKKRRAEARLPCFDAVRARIGIKHRCMRTARESDRAEFTPQELVEVLHAVFHRALIRPDLRFAAVHQRAAA